MLQIHERGFVFPQRSQCRLPCFGFAGALKICAAVVPQLAHRIKFKRQRVALGSGLPAGLKGQRFGVMTDMQHFFKTQHFFGMLLPTSDKGFGAEFRFLFHQHNDFKHFIFRSVFSGCLPIWRISRFAFSNFGFVFIANRQQNRLGHVQIAFFLAVVFKNMRFHNRIGGAGFFAKSAENTFG